MTTFIHGHAKRKQETVEFRAWCKMIARCYDNNDRKYSRYGARGITVCDRWLKSFVAFLEDVGLRPSSKHSLGRIDNDGNYTPENVRWETITQQARNRSNNTLLTHKGRTHCLKEWEEILKLKSGVMSARLRLGWEHERLFSPQMKSFVRRAK